jgi:5,10-methylenetetrahydromethanopterin reductase
MIRRDVAPEDVVQHAIDLASSFDELWVVEDLPFAGGVSQMAAILEATQDVVVGHGIAPAPFRTPAALAMEWATLERMYPGRVACGLGHGVQTWMSQLGEQVDSPLTLIRETCSAVRQLLAGDTVTTAGRYVTIDHVVLEFPPLTPPPVSLGVMGPRSLENSGAVADGTILCEAHGPTEIAAALDRIRVGQAAEKRGPEHRVTVYAAFHVGDEADIVRNPDAPVGWEAVSDDPAKVAESIASLFDAGADSAVLVPLATESRAALVEGSRSVIPLVREHLASSGSQTS